MQEILKIPKGPRPYRYFSSEDLKYVIMSGDPDINATHAPGEISFNCGHHRYMVYVTVDLSGDLVFTVGRDWPYLPDPGFGRRHVVKYIGSAVYPSAQLELFP